MFVAMKIEVLGTGCYNCVKLEALIDGVLASVWEIPPRETLVN
jgi:hypothetical protein